MNDRKQRDSVDIAENKKDYSLGRKNGLKTNWLAPMWMRKAV